MSVQVMGVEMTPDVRSWEAPQRRVGSLLALAVAALVVVAALVTYAFAREAAAVAYWALVVVLVLVLAWMGVLLFVGGARSVPTPSSGEAHPHYGPAGPAPAPAPAPAGEHATLTLRCGDCGTIFDITDTGERPLYHACPGCGAEGALREPPAAYAPEPAPEPMAPPAAPAPAAPKRLKLRCGGCKQVFVIEDTGERPLRRPCPHCGRTGEIR